MLVGIVMSQAAAAAPRGRVIDIGADDTTGELGEEHTAPPPDIRHPSLIQGKLAGDLGAPSGPPIEDPLARRAPAPAGPPGVSIGVRFGAGMFDDTAATARAGIAVAATSRIPLPAALPDALFIAARADGSRRGGDVMASPAVDVLGAGVGLGVTVLGAAAARAAGSLALVAQLRGELRLATRRADAPIHRTGLGLAAGAELALPGTPLTAGLRFEQGLTPLVPGARDRAALVELGLDLR